MTKKTYIEPAWEVYEIETEQQILSGSLDSISSTLDGDEGASLPGSDEPTAGDTWDDAR